MERTFPRSHVQLPIADGFSSVSYDAKIAPVNQRDISINRSSHPLRMWRRLWFAFAALALIGQFALFAHQADHHRRFDIYTADDCAMCQFGTSMASGPKPEPLIVPRNEVIALVLDTTLALPAPPLAAASFRSRAPPAVSFA